MSQPIIQIQHLNKTFGTGPTAVHALEDINLEIEAGEIFGIIGLSGAGKSTLVRCMNLLERPTTGSVLVDGKDLTTKRMPRTPDYYGYFTFSSAPVKNFDFSLSGTYTGKMIVPHYAPEDAPEGAFCNITSDRMEHTPQFLDLNVKLNYTFVLHDHIKLQLNTGVQNIFNSFQKDLDKGEFRDAGYFYGPTQPRTFFIGFKIMN